MTTSPFWLAVLLLPATALAIWAWRALAALDQSLQSLTDFEGMHFEIGSFDADRP